MCNLVPAYIRFKFGTSCGTIKHPKNVKVQSTTNIDFIYPFKNSDLHLYHG